MTSILLEVCTGTYEAALAAHRAGAQRIELCQALGDGGLTPSLGLLRAVLRLPIPRKHVLIRPRPGDFLYTPAEQQIMADDIRTACREGADGIVVGALTADGQVDMAAMRLFIEAAGTVPVTFHRAFDMCADHAAALDALIALGVARVLTSGGCATALEGADAIAALVRRAAGRIVIMPGCGVNAANAADIIRQTGAGEIHASASALHPSAMTYRHDGVSMGHAGADEYAVSETDEEKVRQIMAALDSVGAQ